jgi:NADH dehydrogenase [ubiquinone] 1 alpha subcomplex assembly factor 7
MTFQRAHSFIIGNEFLDCLPVRQFVCSAQGWHEKLVGLDASGRLTFGLGACPARTARMRAGKLMTNRCAVRELAPGLAALIATISQRRLFTSRTRFDY